METVSCEFRENIEGDGDGETAICGLLKLLSGVADDAICRVRRDACVACCRESFQPSFVTNSVTASLLHNLCQKVAEQGGVKGMDRPRAEALKEWAQRSILRDPLPVVRRISACDVVLVCHDSSQQTQRAIDSVLNQEDATVIVHLVDNEGRAGKVIREFSDRWNVISHAFSAANCLAAVYMLLRKLRTEFVAVADSRTLSVPDRIAAAVRTLRERGSEVYACAIATPGGTVRPQPSKGGVSLPAESLVFRRATAIEIAGADCDENANERFVSSCHVDEFMRRVAILGHSVSLDSRELVECEVLPKGRGRFVGSPSSRANDRPCRIECDVVLPFHGQLGYVEESIRGLVEQEDADVVVHLVDDASREDASQFLRRWGSDRRVRVYRNLQNLGQYTSFNNVLPFLETEFVAVQDADDVSLPNRIHHSVSGLMSSDSDVFAAACDLVVDDRFGSLRIKKNPLTSDSQLLKERVRYSHYPTHSYGCFLLNPTLVTRKKFFESLGGFADYRNLLQNRGGLDTEFFQRAFWSGARFHVSRHRLVEMRIHAESATQNSLTGFGSPARRASNAESRRRAQIFSQGQFDPRTFGGLGNHFGLTQRL